MRNRFNNRIFAFILSLILALSIPLAAYAETGTPEENGIYTEAADQELSLEESASQDEEAGLPGDGSETEPPEDFILMEEEAEDAAAPADAAEVLLEDELLPADSGEAAADDEEALELQEEAAADEQGEVQAGSDWVETRAKGTCGANARWELSSGYIDGQYLDVLSITGTGDMYDYQEGDYYSTAPWINEDGKWADKIIIGNGITSIGNYAFLNMYYVKEVVFEGNTVTRIGDSAFYGCYHLATIALPSSLKTIGKEAFDDCSYLDKIGIPGSVTSIGENALYDCDEIFYPKDAASWAAIGGNQAMNEYAVLNQSRSITGAAATLPGTSFAYTSLQVKPAVTVTYGSETLVEGTDYRLVYKNNIERGTATVTVQGINKYYDSVKKTFTIGRRSITGAKITGVKNTEYTGSGVKLALTVKFMFGTEEVYLYEGTDFTVKYTNNKKLSTSKKKATVTITGKGNYSGSVKKSFKVVKANIKNAYVYGLYPKYYYTGKAIKASPELWVYNGNKYVTLKQGKDYTIKYSANKKVTKGKAKAKMTISGKGNYKGKITATFKIVKRANSKIVQRARSWVGKAKYAYGACEPGYFDCSGFVCYCITGKYVRVGNSASFYDEFPRVKNPQPGDIVVSRSHSGIYLGNGLMAHAADERLGILISPVLPGMIYVRDPGPLV